MKMQALALGAVLGFLVAIAPSCGGTKDCGTKNCDGCCKADGTCVAKASSNSAATCGTAGNACVDCSATGQLCNGTTYACVGGAAGGAGGGTAGGSGGGSTGGGTGGGTDAGLPTTCDIAAQDCPVGASCMLANPNTGAAACFAGVCDLVLQNCADTTKRCDVAVVGGAYTRACVAAGNLGEGATCTQGSTSAATSCQKGFLCVSMGTGTPSTCTKYCYQDSDCSIGSQCGALIQNPVPGKECATLCTKVTPCDPLAQDCVAATDSCYPTSATGGLCGPHGSVAVGTTCAALTDCVEGAMCLDGQLDGGSAKFCRALCNTDGGAPACSSGTCFPLSVPAYGACID